MLVLFNSLHAQININTSKNITLQILNTNCPYFMYNKTICTFSCKNFNQYEDDIKKVCVQYCDIIKENSIKCLQQCDYYILQKNNLSYCYFNCPTFYTQKEGICEYQRWQVNTTIGVCCGVLVLLVVIIIIVVLCKKRRGKVLQQKQIQKAQIQNEKQVKKQNQQIIETKTQEDKEGISENDQAMDIQEDNQAIDENNEQQQPNYNECTEQKQELQVYDNIVDSTIVMKQLLSKFNDEQPTQITQRYNYQQIQQKFRKLTQIEKVIHVANQKIEPVAEVINNNKKYQAVQFVEPQNRRGPLWLLNVDI